MDDIKTTNIQATTTDVGNTRIHPDKPKKTVHDWTRDMRMSASVNKATVGVETDSVTPELLLATSKKLLRVSRREEEPDPKDSLEFQRFYGPAELFADHVLRDGGKLGRNLLWKATNKGNLDFMVSGALDKHVSDVFYDSKLAQMMDGSSPLETVDSAYKTTRIGEGGVADMDSAPDEMRTVQSSFFGFLDPVRSPESKRVGLDMFMTKHCMKGSDGKLYQKFINARTGKEELVDSVTAARSVIASTEMMKANTKSIFALGGPTGVRIVPKDKVDYYLARPDDAYSLSANMVVMPSAVKEMRLLMGCLHPSTSVFTINKTNDISINKAINVHCTNSRIPGAGKAGDVQAYQLRNTITKFPKTPSWFKKVVLKSGRSLITSCDHKWAVLKDGKLAMVQAQKLKEGDKVIRTTFKDLPCRRTLLFGALVNKAMATTIGAMCRTVDKPEAERIRFYCPSRLKTAVQETMERMRVADFSFYTVGDMDYVSVRDPKVIEWVTTNIGLNDEAKTIPGVILSAHQDIVAAFLDGYTADDTKTGIDCVEDIWVLDIPNPYMRDCLAMLFARIHTDTLYRDHVRDTGVNLALKLTEQVTEFGDMIVDTVKSVTNGPVSPVMVDIDINDNMYAVANGIVTHNSKYPLQAVSINGRETPLVRGLDEASGKDMSTVAGKYLGAQFAKQNGTVTAVRKNRIDVVYDDGTKSSIALYNNHPMNAKGFIHNTPVVKAGQQFKAGDVLASSNYTDDKGVAAIGTNLRSAWMSWKGGTYEDAVVLSESAAKKLTSTTMYKTAVDLDKTVKLGKGNYMTWKPAEFNKEQMEALDDNGIIKPGSILSKGDPMILAVRTSEPSPGTLGKRVLTDMSEKWEHDYPGMVTDVVKTSKGVKVFATISAPAEIGDKIAGLYGNKCYDGATEILTDKGYVAFKDLPEDVKVLQVWQDYSSDFTTPITRQVFDHDDYMCRFVNEKIDFLVTPYHRMAAILKDDFDRGLRELTIYTAESLVGKDFYVCDRIGDNHTFALCDATDSSRVSFSDKVYCVTVPSSMVMVRRNGKQAVCGNCEIAQIIPDNQMPTDKKGNPLDILWSPLGLISRTNQAQIHEAGLAKVAAKTGKHEVMPAFFDGDLYEYVSNKMKQHNVSADEDLVDPETGKIIPKILTGYSYVHKLKHLAESKMSARGTSEYTSEGLPGGKGFDGSKRLGTMEISALTGHNAFDIIEDAKIIRGQSNSDFWRSIRTGEIPTVPGEPLIHKKFFSHLQGSGVNVRKTARGISVFALSNGDIDELAGPREVTTRDTYEAKNFRPIDGGLFGQDIFGINGDKWGYIKLDEPLPNPVMEEPLARLLRIPDKQFVAVASGAAEVDGMKSAADIKDRLKAINLDTESAAAKKELEDAPLSMKDKALKRYVAIERMRRAGVHPADYMLDKIPVIPPIYRPISSHNGLTMVADSNYLYAQLLDARDDLREAKSLPEEYRKDARTSLYKKWKELTGLYEPESASLKNKHVQGLLKWALGDSPKWSGFQRKVLGATVDTVGRGVITPDPRLKLNEVGVPKEMAYGIMAPFVERALVKRGYTPVEAIKQVKNKTPQSFEILKEVLKTQPVLMNRAPTLHKLNIMAFNPVLVDGHSIRINPSIVVPFNADFDGDQVNLHAPVSDKAKQEAYNKMMPERNLIAMKNRQILYKPEKEYQQGLYIATRMKSGDKVKTQIFNTLEEARQAAREGIIDVDDPIIIKNK